MDYGTVMKAPPQAQPFRTGGRAMKMTIRQAIRVLMQSPLYFRMRPRDRYAMLVEFCQTCNG